MKKVTYVYWIGMVIAVVFVIWGVVFPENITNVMETSKAFLLEQFGWFYLLATFFFLIFAIYLIFSKYGKVKLGKDEDEPEYSRASWIAMLFSAGMGIGLLFYGISEPIAHLVTPPFGEAGTTETAKVALQYTYLNWGIHAWAIYAVVALALAYFKFRKDAPGIMSATLYPILGEKTKGPIGITVDIIAVFATVFGVAASLGLGAAQINGGLSYLTGIPNAFWIQVIIILVTTALFILSASTGINKGIKYLSNANMVLAVVLFVAFLLLGPLQFVISLLMTTLGGYIQNLPMMSFRMAPFNQENAAWVQNWTIFFFAWWIAWAPFVGTFIARISKGRTIREFIIVVMVVPTAVCILWFGVFGGTGIYYELFQGANIAGQGVETALFATFNMMPGSGILSTIALLLIATFFITSADSATFVLGMQTTNGSLHPPNFVKISWGLFLTASALILMGRGGLSGLQTAIIVSALPLTVILLLMSISILKELGEEPVEELRLEKKLEKIREKRKRKQMKGNLQTEFGEEHDINSKLRRAKKNKEDK
ncbi:BCCT family transporter [Aquibacillus albus]|uniref:Glycine betaine transporter n=1 Tax=Aquibacillus albus TaxID=1168171 RepID=A0ABS2N5M1_9BACI|nr:BCCT family transporter [Aquibacillus albus]MBM7573440.1 glycine betaine transporter [Aquibacillus albus]